MTAENLPAERRVSHLIDLARAYSYIARDEEASQALLAAEDQAAQLVYHSPSARETIKRIQRRTPASNGPSSPFAALAEKARAIA